jgi:glycosyltransferase involved in cell wall biosynthesis
MTVYNGIPYLSDAVDSVRRQTLTDWKLIVVDDGSTDGSGAWLDALDDPRICVVHQQNAGAPVASNRGLELCDTEFVARLDADDLALPTRLEKQLAHLRAHPQVGLVGTQFKWLCQGRTGNTRPIPCDHRAIDARHMSGRHGLVHSSMMCRTQLLREVGGYWPYGVGEDYDLFLRVGERAELANLDEVLLHVRVVPGSLQSQNMPRLRSLVAYAGERARRRRERLPGITFEEFCELRKADPWWTRLGRALDVQALTQYRKAQNEILGGRRLRGYARLAAAAACSPQLTWQRIESVARKRWLALRKRPQTHLRSEAGEGAAT